MKDLSNVRQSSNYRPGEPLRRWDSSVPSAPWDLDLLLQRSQAVEVMARVLDGRKMTDQEIVVLARLNSWCVHDWYEPLVSLIKEPRMTDMTAAFVEQHSKEIAELRATTKD